MRHAMKRSVIVTAAFLVTVVPAVQLMGTTQASATAPGRNGRIAFQRTIGGKSVIYTIAPNGTHITKLVANASYPAWSPAGTRIAFVSHRSGTDAIWVMRADGSGLHQVTTPGRSADLQPTWSPTGQSIAFTRVAPDGNSQIWIKRLGAGPAHELTTSLVQSSSQPAWSPDGHWIAFAFQGTCCAAWQTTILLIRPDGTRLHDLTPFYSGNPSWSPDGKQIAFNSLGTRTGSDIWVVALNDGSRRLTTDSANDSDPVWSPDGRTIAFTSNRMGAYKIFTMNPSGGSVHQVTWLQPYPDLHPDWQPITG